MTAPQRNPGASHERDHRAQDPGGTTPRPDIPTSPGRSGTRARKRLLLLVLLCATVVLGPAASWVYLALYHAPHLAPELAAAQRMDAPDELGRAIADIRRTFEQYGLDESHPEVRPKLLDIEVCCSGSDADRLELVQRLSEESLDLIMSVNLTEEAAEKYAALGEDILYSQDIDQVRSALVEFSRSVPFEFENAKYVLGIDSRIEPFTSSLIGELRSELDPGLRWRWTWDRAWWLWIPLLVVLIGGWVVFSLLLPDEDGERDSSREGPVLY